MQGCAENGDIQRHGEGAQGGREQPAKVAIDAPNPEELDIQHLAQVAWFRPGKILKIGSATVSVKAFRKSP